MAFTHEQAVKFTANQINLLEATLQGGLGLSYQGTTELLKRGVENIYACGEMNIPIIRRILDQLKKDQPLMRDDVPFPNDPHLDFLTSIEAAQEMPKEKLRKFLQPVAAEKDASGTSLLERFNARTQWLKHNDVHRPEEAPAAPTKPLSEKEKAAAAAKAVVDAIKEEIDSIPGHSPYADSQRKRLHARLNNLLADMPRAKFFDRYGSQEWLTGWPAVQRIIREEIRDKDNPIR